MTLKMAYGSHIPVLVHLLSITNGPVLEMGMGYFSTPVLHWLCMQQKRILWSIENDPKYFYRFDVHESPYHFTELVGDWDRAQILYPWDVVLIDHAPPERRIIDIARLSELAKYIVIHDTRKSQEKHYHYSEIWPLFKYRWDYDVHCALTVVSNFIDITEMKI